MSSPMGRKIGKNRFLLLDDPRMPASMGHRSLWCFSGISAQLACYTAFSPKVGERYKSKGGREDFADAPCDHALSLLESSTRSDVWTLSFPFLVEQGASERLDPHGSLPFDESRRDPDNFVKCCHASFLSTPHGYSHRSIT